MIAKRGKLIGVLLTVAAIALAGIPATQEWTHVSAADTEPFSLTGAELSTALPAMVLALGALALTLLFAGRRLSVVCAVALVLLGAGILWSSLSASGPENSVIIAEVAARTGLSGSEVTSVETVTLPPLLSAGGGALAALAGVWVLLTSGKWHRQPKSRDKYELRSGALAWDVLDEGEDPTLDAEPGANETDTPGEAKGRPHGNENV